MSEGRNNQALERLRALDQAIARRGASAQTRAEVRHRLQRRAVEQPFHARLRWWPALAFAAGAITMGVLVLSGEPGEAIDRDVASAGVVDAGPITRAPHAPDPPSAEPAAIPAKPTCATLEPGPVQLAADECAQGNGTHVSARLPSHLEWDGEAVELRSGELLFDIAPRPDHPLHVTAGAVDIEVVGTRFVVHHQGTRGWISMLEGHVRVRVGGGSAEDLRDGQRLEWRDPQARDPQTRVPAKRTSPQQPPERSGRDEGLAELLDEVAQLRRRGAYQQAVERLRAGDQRGWSRRAHQLVSYEVGTLLERQIGDTAGACAHWAAHRRRYPDGRYDSILARAMERLHCDEEP